MFGDKFPWFIRAVIRFGIWMADKQLWVILMGELRIPTRREVIKREWYLWHLPDCWDWGGEGIRVRNAVLQLF